MKIGRINKIVEQAFKNNYSNKCDGYTLITVSVNEKINHLGYAITKSNHGIMVEFYVSNSGIYSASSKDELLSSTYEIKDWLRFLEEVKTKLYEEQPDGIEL